MDVGVVFWLVIGAVAVAGVIGNSYAASKKNALIESLIEKGQPIPPALFEGRKPYDWRGFMVGGVILLAAGIGLAIFFCALITWQVHDEEQRFLPFISAFPISLGAACLLIARYLKNNG
ncbi:MAG TPA: DUF6249 domain-containing protein [Rhizomicrobium sp.]|jgi:hypothetical protein|nr:DUF6249 domain-containing protein [Rhizomicrobium sp.]